MRPVGEQFHISYNMIINEEGKRQCEMYAIVSSREQAISFTRTFARRDWFESLRRGRDLSLFIGSGKPPSFHFADRCYY